MSTDTFHCETLVVWFARSALIVHLSHILPIVLNYTLILPVEKNSRNQTAKTHVVVVVVIRISIIIIVVNYLLLLLIII